jgi:hypothetical protein
VQRHGRTRTNRTDLLVRPPCSDEEREGGWAALVADPVEQLATLADLHSRGVLSRDEFERQKGKIDEPW